MKTFRLFSMTALALMMAACSSEDNALETASPAMPGLIPFSATVAPLSGATTRTVYTPGTNGESKPIINVAWKEGDQIYITRLSPDFGTAGTVTVGKPNGDGSAPLSGNISGADGSEIEAQYPASATDWGIFTGKYIAQDGTLSGIQDNLDYRKGTGKISVIGGKATLATALQMESQIAIWKLTLQNTSGANLNATKVTIKDGSNIIAATKDISATSEVHMAVPFNTSPTTFSNLTIEATTAAGIYTYAAPSAVNLSHSTYYQSTVKMTNTSQATPLTFEAKEAGASVTFKTYTGSTLSAPEYSTDGSSWTRYTWGTAITLEKVGDKVMFRGDNATYAGGGSYAYSTFTCDKDCYIYGNVMSLVSSTGYVSATTLTAGSTFRKLFEKNTHIVNHPTLSIVLPATTLTNSCYYAMFDGCSQLTKAPALPATKMEQGCYWGMFSETGITAAPALPAQTLANACYMLMFDNCPHLTTPPALPATTLAESCYAGMFLQCSSLEYAPELPATTMMKNCYYTMFYMCGKITTAPVLPAATLAEGCYMSMFSQCTNLNSVTCLATNISAKNCTYDWLTGVAATGTFTKAGEMTGWTTGGNGIPTGWTVQ